MPVTHLIMAILLAAGAFVLGASVAFADGSGDPAAVKNEGGKYYDKESNPTFKVQSDCRLVHVFRVSPLSFGLPCLSRSRRRRIELRARPQQFPQDHELSRCGQRAQERKHGAGERHARVRHEPERHVLSR